MAKKAKPKPKTKPKLNPNHKTQPKQKPPAPDQSPYSSPPPTRLSAPAAKKSKFRQESEAAKPSEKLRQKPLSGTSGQVDPRLNGNEKPKTKEEKAAAKESKQFDESKLRAEKSESKLDSAREKLANQEPYKPPGVASRLTHMAGFEVAAQVHRKIHEVERENVGVEAAHKAEIFGERTGRAAVRHVKHRIRTRPARQVRKMEKENIKANADYHFRELAIENPELNNNAIKRHLHKKRIQKQFQKQAQEAAKKGAKKATEESATIVGKAGRAVVEFVKNHPKGVMLLALCFLIIVTIQSCTAMSLSMFSGLGSGAIGGTTYLSEDADMLGAEAAYAGLEADLQYRLNNYAALNPGYHEYHYHLDEIGHDPYVLISILGAFHDEPWTLDEVHGMLVMLFDRQYILTETVTVEVRYRTETRTGGYIDDEGNSHTYTYTVEVPYDYYICTVTLENFNLSHVPIHIMSETQLSRYALYIGTLGNRPDLFPVHLYPRASTYLSYSTYDIPQEYLDADPVFAAMIAEANKFCGYPYIWGGYCPATSFDCSGYVSWILNNSGWDIGRLGAQGLYNICSPVSAANARPGDLIFFVGTYDTPGVSHVGLYVGDSMMVHAGNPIGYVTINTAYWQSHFYAFGRP